MESAEVLRDSNAMQWVPIIDGIDFKLLRVSQESGAWTVLFRCQPGSFFPIHKHHGAGEYFVITGRMQYVAGEAVAGCYGYEPLGALHEKTLFPEYTELLFTNHGPVAFLDDDGNIKQILDYALLCDLADAA